MFMGTLGDCKHVRVCVREREVRACARVCEKCACEWSQLSANFFSPPSLE